MVVVADVEAASSWFQAVLGVTSDHGGPNYEMLLDGAEIVAHLHQGGRWSHPRPRRPERPVAGLRGWSSPVNSPIA